MDSQHRRGALSKVQAVAVDDDGYVYVTGMSQGTETDFDYSTLKYDTDGNELWSKHIMAR